MISGNSFLFTENPVLNQSRGGLILRAGGCSRPDGFLQGSVRLRDLPAYEEIMPDDKKKPGGQDRTRINVNEDYELRDWSKKFGVTKDELKKAVAKVGTSAEAVKNHLRR